MQTTKFYLTHKIDNENYLLVNTLTGATDLVKENVILYLRNPNSIQIEEEIKERLLARGYIAEKCKDDVLLNKVSNFWNSNRKNLFVICPTYSCNLRCSYCFEDINIRMKGGVLTEKEVDKIFDAIKRISELTGREEGALELYGGEPLQLSTKGTVSYIFEKASMNNYPVQIITNGVNVNLFEDVFRKYDKCFEYIQITLDGPKEIHDKLRIKADKSGSFDAIVTNIDLLLNIGINVGLRVNIGKDNVSYLPQLLALIKSKKWNKSNKFTCSLCPIEDHYCTGETPNWLPQSELLKKIYDLFDDFENIREEFNLNLGKDIERRTRIIRSIWAYDQKITIPDICACGASSGRQYIFGADGYIYNCLESVGIKEFASGKFLPEFTFDSQTMKKWNRNIRNIEKCRNCNISPLCGSCCTWSSLVTNGIEFKEPVCNNAQETIRDFFVLNNERILKEVL